MDTYGRSDLIVRDTGFSRRTPAGGRGGCVWGLAYLLELASSEAVILIACAGVLSFLLRGYLCPKLQLSYRVAPACTLAAELFPITKLGPETEQARAVVTSLGNGEGRRKPCKRQRETEGTSPRFQRQEKLFRDGRLGNFVFASLAGFFGVLNVQALFRRDRPKLALV